MRRKIAYCVQSGVFFVCIINPRGLGALWFFIFSFLISFISSFFENIPYVFSTYRPTFYNRAIFLSYLWRIEVSPCWLCSALNVKLNRIDKPSSGSLLTRMFYYPLFNHAIDWWFSFYLFLSSFLCRYLRPTYLHCFQWLRDHENVQEQA